MIKTWGDAVRRESLGVCHGQILVIGRVLRVGITGHSMCLAAYHWQMDFSVLRQCFSSGTAAEGHTPYVKHGQAKTDHKLPLRSRPPDFHNFKLIQRKIRTTTFGIKSFSYYGAHLWNSLPVDIKNAVTLGNFEILVKNWQGPSCHCSVCQLIIWIRIFTVIVLISITVSMLFFSILSISRGYLTPKIRNTPTIHP